MSQTEKKISARIKTDDTLMETALHGNSLFPFRFYDEKMEDFHFNHIGILNLNLCISNPGWCTFTSVKKAFLYPKGRESS